MFLEILLSLATISIFSLLALRPTVITIAGLIKEIETKKETVSRMDEKIQKLAQAQDLYDREIRRVQLLATSVPKEPSPVAFVRQIEGLSGKHSVSILAMSLKEVTLIGDGEIKQVETPESVPRDGAGELPFAINTTASFPSLFNYLTDLEKTRRPVKLDSLTIKSTEAEEGKTLLLVVEGQIPYFEGEKQNLP